MSFVSFAQNLEDVMLWRALQNIHDGFYVDVGANDPEVDSVTKVFYDRGWHGINIEPIDQWFRRLEEKRPRDVNLQVAAGAKTGKLVMYELPDTGLSTLEKSTAERHEAERGYKKIERSVPVETLTSICERLDVTAIHFLKIDVEGAEKQVLEGLDLEKIRPWIIVIESTLPNTQTDDHHLWSGILGAANYEDVYFDGLNRYFVAKEHEELKKYFTAPPNVFDDYVLKREVDTREKVTQAESRATRAESRATQAESRVDALLASRSWRVTAPLRWLSLQIHLLGTLGFAARCKAAIKRLIRGFAAVVSGYPRFRAVLLRVLDHFPLLKARLTRIVLGPASIKATVLPVEAQVLPEDRTLTPRAREIRDDLLFAMEHQERVA